jgi:hypothetical protein
MMQQKPFDTKTVRTRLGRRIPDWPTKQRHESDDQGATAAASAAFAWRLREPGFRDFIHV